MLQVVGSKYIRLYKPCHSAQMYPHTEGLHQNTSQVFELSRRTQHQLTADASWKVLSIDSVDSTKFPLFGDAPYYECYLQAGQVRPEFLLHVCVLCVFVNISAFGVGLSLMCVYSWQCCALKEFGATKESLLALLSCRWCVQMLYIPPRWWHYVESVETSFSVSFWWWRKILYASIMHRPISKWTLVGVSL